MINSKRMGELFTEFAQIDSESLDEAEIAGRLKDILTEMGGSVAFDNAGDAIGGNCSNMVAKFKGNCDAEPLFLSGHMDTVVPGKGVKVIFEDGVFRSDGTTILGSDDKSALAIIIEVLKVIQENDLPCPPIELVLTVAEEMGLLGAKHFDFSMMDSKFGYILDSTDTEGIVTRAPAANKIAFKFYGKAAHAGAEPENGVNAIYAAACALSKLELGRIDEVTTTNMGLISGGAATNIVPEFVEIKGEARSHNPEKLEEVTQAMVDTVEKTIADLRGDGEFPKVEAIVEVDFPNTNIPEDHQAVTLARKAAGNLGYELESKTIGGGADANIFFGKGIMAGVLGTGMTDVHTLKESIKMSDMENTARLVLEILQVHAAGEKN